MGGTFDKLADGSLTSTEVICRPGEVEAAGGDTFHFLIYIFLKNSVKAAVVQL